MIITVMVLCANLLSHMCHINNQRLVYKQFESNRKSADKLLI